MKDKISISLSKDIVAEVDKLAGTKKSRSAFIEKVLRKYVRERRRAALNARDLERINGAADQLNQEAADVLKYQSLDSDTFPD